MVYTISKAVPLLYKHTQLQHNSVPPFYKWITEAFCHFSEKYSSVADLQDSIFIQKYESQIERSASSAAIIRQIFKLNPRVRAGTTKTVCNYQ